MQRSGTHSFVIKKTHMQNGTNYHSVMPIAALGPHLTLTNCLSGREHALKNSLYKPEFHIVNLLPLI
jgi:hypothetical protein